MKVANLQREQFWECPNCDLRDRTIEANPHTRFHQCRGLKGMMAPMVPAGTKCKVEAVERGDYEGREITTKDIEGRSIMSVVTTRDDGQDCAVFAPQAQAEIVRGDI